MKRHIYQQLTDWRLSAARKPLILRGARQVGKTHIVRTLGKDFSNFVEINFEKEPKFHTVFEKDLNAKRIIRDLALLSGQEIIPGKTLLFFDEIQEVQKAITALRYFYEECSELHVIAAGSLLDFSLENTSVPVGRVDFLSMYPMSFIEFLRACGLALMSKAILEHEIHQALTESVHQQILETLAVYMAVGGMPEAVKKWIETSEIAPCIKVHHSLIETYKQDFQKYATKFQIKYIDLLFDRVPAMLGNKFQYKDIPGEYRKRELAPCLDLLEKANVIHRVLNSAGQGVPLGAQAKSDHFKVIFLDVALAQTILGLEVKDWLLSPTQSLINKGAIVEAFVGQEILAYSDPYQKTQLYYWCRESRNSNAEVDYLMQYNQLVLPIEVKGGKSGQLKSAKIFLEEHQRSPYGIRFSAHNFSIYDWLRSYPLYAVANMLRSKLCI